jgi:hypothetical protein
VAYASAVAIGIVGWCVALATCLDFGGAREVWDSEIRATAIGVVFLSLVPILLSIGADVCVFVTGIRILRRSPKARRSASYFACQMVPLVAADVWTASQLGDAAWLVLPLVLPLPVYAVAQGRCVLHRAVVEGARPLIRCERPDYHVIFNPFDELNVLPPCAIVHHVWLPSR